MSNPNDKQFRRALPFFVEFVKFGSIFAVLVIGGLLALRFTSGG